MSQSWASEEEEIPGQAGPKARSEGRFRRRRGAGPGVRREAPKKKRRQARRVLVRTWWLSWRVASRRAGRDGSLIGTQSGTARPAVPVAQWFKKAEAWIRHRSATRLSGSKEGHGLCPLTTPTMECGRGCKMEEVCGTGGGSAGQT